MESGKDIYNGALLYATPFLFEPHLKHVVVLITEHNELDTTGFVINKMLGLKVNQVILDKISLDVNVYLGGPVGQDELYYIHKKGEKVPGSRLIRDGFSWGGKFDVIKRMIDNGEMVADDIRFLIGYTGWAAHQLEDELNDDAWVKMNDKLSYSWQHADAWEKKMLSLGGRYALWSGFPPGPWPN